MNHITQQAEALAQALAEVEAVRKANLDCVAHYEELRADLAALAQQPALEDDKLIQLETANQLLDTALLVAHPEGSTGTVFELWNKARIIIRDVNLT